MFDQYGLIVRNIIADGVLHRCGTEKKPNGNNGWYIAFSDGGYLCGNWETGEEWFDKGAGDIDYKKADDARKKHKENKVRAQLAVADDAVSYLVGCADNGHSEYLQRKKIGHHGAKFKGNKLIIPMQDNEGKIWGYQTIFADGYKLFQVGGRVAGLYHKIGFDSFSGGRVVVCEGFATGASIYENTGLPVVVAFNANNIKAVADSLPYTDIVIAADNDASGVGERAAKDSGYQYVMPVVSGDFNDLALNGADIASYFSVGKSESPSCAPAHGLVGDIADWITATALYPKPELSLAAAISFVSLLKAHRYSGYRGCRTNLLLLGIAPTGSGKEWPQKCVRRLSKQSGLSDHLMGDPASGSGFLAALEMTGRRSLYLCDEVGRFLANLKNKNSQVYHNEIIDYMMKAFSKADSVLQGKVLADQEKNKYREIVQPNFSCFGLTVKEELEKACTSTDVLNGFLNRWILVESPGYVDENHRDGQIIDYDIPDNILAKINHYTAKPIEYNLYNEPNLEEICMTPEAFDYYREVQRSYNEKIRTTPWPANALYVRCSESIAKLALVLASPASDGLDLIEIEDVKLAHKIVEDGCKSMLSMVDMLSDNVNHEYFNKAKKIIKDSKIIQKSEFTIQTQFMGDKRRRSEIVESLIDGNYITEYKEGRKTFYKWIQ